MQTFFESEKRSLIFLSLLWLVAAVIVNPIGEFPVNDDGLYSYTVKSLVEESVYAFNQTYAANLILQVFWGYLFCKIGGEFSFTALRISTVVMGYLAMFVTFFLAKQQLKSIPKATLTTIFIVFNPVFFSLAYTFMTDVPFFTLALMSIWMYAQFIKTNALKFKVLALVFVLCSFMIRQPGILIIFVFELGVFLLNPKTSRNFLKLILHFGIGFFFYFGVEYGVKGWLGIRDLYMPVEKDYFTQLFYEPHIFCFQLAKRTLMTIFHLGLFALPLIIPVFKELKALNFLKNRWLIPIGVFNILVIIALWQVDYVFPYGGNIFYNWGLGPVLLKDVYVLKTTVLPRIPLAITMIFGFICQVYGCYLMILLIERIKFLLRNVAKSQFLFILVAFNVGYLGLMLIFNFFDRYLLLPFLTLLLVLLPQLKIASSIDKKSIVILTCSFMLFAIVGTKDFMNWHRAAATAWTSLESKGVSVEDIDNGLAFNQFYKKKLNITNDSYLITMGKVVDYEKQDSFIFKRNLWFAKGYVYILKRKNE